MKVFGKRIKELRMEKRILQREIAEHLGVTVRTYQYYESGKLEPNLANLVKLADLFEISVDYLLCRTDQR